MKKLEKEEITQNGFLREEEDAIVYSLKQTRREKNEGKLRFLSVDDFINAIDKECLFDSD